MKFDLEKIVRALADHEVEFVILGGVAVSIYSSAYVTYDFDVCYSRSSENLKRIVAALAPFNPRFRGFPDDLPFFWDERTLLNGTNFTLVTDIGDVDLLGEVSGVGTFAEAVKNSIQIDLLGTQAHILSLEDLIKAKRAAGRPKDLNVLPELIALQEALTDED